MGAMAGCGVSYITAQHFPAIGHTLGPWFGHRIGYLQHANGPVTGWDWSLALHKPDWLSEPRGGIVCLGLTIGATGRCSNANPNAGPGGGRDARW